MKIVASVTIPAARESIWQTFMAVQKWPDWSPWQLRFPEEERFTPGGRFHVITSLPVLHFLMLAFPCEVTKYQNPKVICWSGRVFGIPGYHQFSIEEAPGGYRLVSEEKFNGPFAVFLYPFRWIIKGRVLTFLEQLSRATVAAYG